MNRQLGGVQGQLEREFEVKAWALIAGGTTDTIRASRNVAAVTDNGAGDTTVTWSVPFATASSYAALLCTSGSTNAVIRTFVGLQSQTASSIRTDLRNFNAVTPVDPSFVYVGALGEY